MSLRCLGVMIKKKVVWAATEKVGCGFNYCSNIEYPLNVVCNYAPVSYSNSESVLLRLGWEF